MGCLLTYNCTEVFFRWLLTPTVAIFQLYRGGFFFSNIRKHTNIIMQKKTFSLLLLQDVISFMTSHNMLLLYLSIAKQQLKV